jgi:RNA polymerase sigma factor (sigma-70 family)
MARARAARLCPQPDDADDAVQDAFLQAFIALDRLRDPSRFAGWLGGIVANVCRAQRRRAPLTLLGDWPENLHPAGAGSLPSAEDLDRAEALGRAVAGLPPGQRQAVSLFYYADQPASQVAGTPGAAKASLHKARRRLREYITAHRPDLIPATSRRTSMTAVRIAHIDWPARTPDGRISALVVLADTVPTDDGGHRALPVRLPARGGALWRLLARPEDRDAEHPDDDAGEMTDRLLRGAGITVTAVTVTDLGPGVTTTRIDITSPGGTQQVTTRLADGLALAVSIGAPLTVDDRVMDRLAEPVTSPDLLSPFRSHQQPPPGRQRTPGSSRATWRSPTACTDGSSMAPSCARPGSTTRTIPAPPKTGGRSWPRPCPNPPDSPSSARGSNPTTTAAARSPSAATCVPPTSPIAPDWCSASPAKDGDRPHRIHGTIPRTTSPPSAEPATGPATRSPPRSRPMPSASSSASS